MRGRRTVGAFVLGATLAIAGASAQAGVAVTPQVLQGLFVFNDEDQGGADCANIEINGDTHQVNGVATGIGLASDTVTLTYSTPFVEDVVAAKERGLVRQRRQSQIDVEILPGAGSTTLAYTGTANPSQGRVSGVVQNAGSNSRVRVHFRLGESLSGLAPAPDTDQLNSIVAAFESRDDVKIQEKPGRVVIRQRGIANPGTCP